MTTTESLDSNTTDEFSTEGPDGNPERPGLKELLGAELQALALEGVRYKKLIAEAKTKPKKKLYNNKLKKNSKRAAELILYLERLQISDAIEQSKQQQEFIDIRDSSDDNVEGDREGAEA